MTNEVKIIFFSFWPQFSFIFKNYYVIWKCSSISTICVKNSVKGILESFEGGSKNYQNSQNWHEGGLITINPPLHKFCLLKLLYFGNISGGAQDSADTNEGSASDFNLSDSLFRRNITSPTSELSMVNNGQTLEMHISFFVILNLESKKQQRKSTDTRWQMTLSNSNKNIMTLSYLSHHLAYGALQLVPHSRQK